MIGVEDSGGSASQVASFGKRTGVTYPLFNDPGQLARRTFKVRYTSTTYIIAPDYTIQDVIVDGTSEQALQDDFGKYGMLGS